MSTATSRHKPCRTRLRGPRSRMWKVGAWVPFGVLALLVLAGIAVTVVLHSARFHNYVLSTAQKRPAKASALRYSYRTSLSIFRILAWIFMA